MKSKNLLLLVLFLSSCASTHLSKVQVEEQKMMNTWIGHSKSELLRTWGPAKNISSDGQGGEIYSFEKTMSFGQSAGQVYAGSSNNIYYTNPQNRVATRVYNFFIDKTGKIYTWQLSGRQGY